MSVYKCKFLTFLSVLLLLIHQYPAVSSDDGIVMNPPPLGICASAVTKYGYKCQEIDVTTEDGYILSVQRIPEGRSGGAGGGGRSRQPVLLQHGVLVIQVQKSPSENLEYPASLDVNDNE